MLLHPASDFYRKKINTLLPSRLRIIRGKLADATLLTKKLSSSRQVIILQSDIENMLTIIAQFSNRVTDVIKR